MKKLLIREKCLVLMGMEAHDWKNGRQGEEDALYWLPLFRNINGESAADGRKLMKKGLLSLRTPWRFFFLLKIRIPRTLFYRQLQNCKKSLINFVFD